MAHTTIADMTVDDLRKLIRETVIQTLSERHVPMLERILASGQFNGCERHDLELALQAARERKTPEA